MKKEDKETHETIINGYLKKIKLKYKDVLEMRWGELHKWVTGRYSSGNKNWKRKKKQ